MDDAAEERGLFLHAEDDASPTVSSTQSDVGKQVMRTVPWWVLPWTYAALELVTLFTRQTTLFGFLTGNIYGNMGRSLLLRVHVWSAIFMWMLGGCQMSARFLRKSYPSLHKVFGYGFLALWMLVVGPSAAILSLLVEGDSVLGTLSAVTLLDVTFLSYFLFYRAWRVARRREQGAHSLNLHGQLMGLGCLCTMAQLPQRAIQAALIACRATVVAPLELLHWHGTAHLLRYWWSDQGIFGASMAMGNFFILTLVDGPRTAFLKRKTAKWWSDTMYGQSERDEMEMWDYDVGDARTRWRWRARFAAYAIARGIVTGGWTTNPIRAP